MSVVSIKNLDVEYDSHKVLDNVSFEVNDGEVLGVVGLSGSGKTTLLKVISGQIKKANGEVCIDKKAQSSMGLVMDSMGLFVRLTCRQNLLIFADIYGVSKSRVDEILQKVNLEADAKKRVYKLSKGMRKRLAVAMAMLRDPKLLILDEPTCDLDPLNTEYIHELISDFKAKGATTVFTTHDMSEAERICDRVAILKNGILVVCDTPQNICTKYNVSTLERAFFEINHGGMR